MHHLKKNVVFCWALLVWVIDALPAISTDDGLLPHRDGINERIFTGPNFLPVLADTVSQLADFMANTNINPHLIKRYLPKQGCETLYTCTDLQLDVDSDDKIVTADAGSDSMDSGGSSAALEKVKVEVPPAKRNVVEPTKDSLREVQSNVRKENNTEDNAKVVNQLLHDAKTLVIDDVDPKNMVQYKKFLVARDHANNNNLAELKRTVSDMQDYAKQQFVEKETLKKRDEILSRERSAPTPTPTLVSSEAQKISETQASAILSAKQAKYKNDVRPTPQPGENPLADNKTQNIKQDGRKNQKSYGGSYRDLKTKAGEKYKNYVKQNKRSTFMAYNKNFGLSKKLEFGNNGKQTATKRSTQDL